MLVSSNAQTFNWCGTRPSGHSNGNSAAGDSFQSSGKTECFPKWTDLAQAAKSPDPKPLTLTDVEGPYYRANAPVRSNLFPNSEQSGERVEYNLQVTDPHGKPVNCRVDVWTADAAGTYDMDSPVFRGRAQQDQSGDQPVHFEAIKPGNYFIGEQNGEKLYRPAHVHIKVHVPGQKPLTTQLYFPGDKWNTLDPIVDPNDRERGFDPSLLMTETDKNKFSYTFVVPGK